LRLKKCDTDMALEPGSVLSRGSFSINIRPDSLHMFEIYAVDIIVQFSSAKNGAGGMLQLWGTSRKAIV
jgi:hypothetical protein